MYTPFRFEPFEMPANTSTLREEVREFLSDWTPGFTPHALGLSWMGLDRAFSRAVGAKGWIGMTWPVAYGGRERSMLERYVVIEEMLAAGAPVGAHWIADRQSGPLILKLGSEEQKRKYLPGIIAGVSCFCIGLSEPDSGSDLASVRTRALPDGDDWVLSGRKIWTTNAHHSDYMIALVRTEGSPEDRHRGLSQLIVPMAAEGVEIRQIHDMAGDAHFNEVTFDDVRLPADALIGAQGSGWQQVTSELAFERSGPDRYMSAFPLLRAAIAATTEVDRLATRRIGDAVAELAVLRQMSVSIAGMLGKGDEPSNEAAVVKDLGVDFEQSAPDLVRDILSEDIGRGSAGEFSELYSALLQISPTFSLRGGTREIVRGIMARGLGLR